MKTTCHLQFKAQCEEHSIQNPQDNSSKVGWDVFLFLFWLIMLLQMINYIPNLPNWGYIFEVLPFLF